jgi:hypothetical protein
MVVMRSAPGSPATRVVSTLASTLSSLMRTCIRARPPHTPQYTRTCRARATSPCTRSSKPRPVSSPLLIPRDVLVAWPVGVPSVHENRTGRSS